MTTPRERQRSETMGTTVYSNHIVNQARREPATTKVACGDSINTLLRDARRAAEIASHSQRLLQAGYTIESAQYGMTVTKCTGKRTRWMHIDFDGAGKPVRVEGGRFSPPVWHILRVVGA